MSHSFPIQKSKGQVPVCGAQCGNWAPHTEIFSQGALSHTKVMVTGLHFPEVFIIA